MTKGGWVYIMADRYRGGIYVGVTADLVRRVQQHRDGAGSEHVLRHGLTRIVHAERFDEILAAIAREKQLKRWRREWKFALIEAHNPDWRDLWDDWFPVHRAQEQRDPGSSPG
ncbi:MAG: GIY-YIG nuclease family protein [Sandarakinorhabdus sp.]|jgi:putative endonuclease|nr:GIY-YIG nuclease family protein [Sandarakinorhabdus sp.]